MYSQRGEGGGDEATHNSATLQSEFMGLVIIFSTAVFVR